MFTAARQLQVARLIEAVVNSVPANADVHLEINQNPHGFEPHIEIQQTPQQQPTGTTITSTSTNGSPEQGAQGNHQNSFDQSLKQKNEEIIWNN